MTEAAQRKKKKIWESSERYASHSIIRLSFVPNRVFLGVFQQYFSYIMEISFIDGGNLSTWRISKTCCKSLTNSIKQCCIEYTSQWTGFELATSVVIGTDCTSSCKSNYHMITNTTAPEYNGIIKWKTKNTIQIIFVCYRCITTKHGYQSKRTYGKVVRKQKMDSYIVG